MQPLHVGAGGVEHRERQALPSRTMNHARRPLDP
jgi:hypothetical protein